ncbi:ras-related protein Rab-44 isoform X2 [Zootermopsis nevadensis]|uniref:ras-related protein Rab-44 isoform X2 n=1 Tax=Zootermopsis nevadensis TaxID=136037 RepID=UPI000B8E528C|nr:ras-related protein Rab-44 isoform X2 [Zootermopsis nevadensis]
MEDISSGVSSPEFSELKNSVSTSKTGPLSAETSGAKVKTTTKSRTGGVKLGSFRLGGRRKISSEGDSSTEVKEDKRKLKKHKKETSGKPESEDSAASTQSVATKQSLSSRTSSLVRKLSIGRHRSSGSGGSLKSPDTPSSQEFHSASTEEDCFFPASSSTGVTDGRPSQEGIISAAPTQDVLSPIDQSTARTKVSKSESSINDATHCNGDSVTKAMSGIKDNLPNPESQDGTPDVVQSEKSEANGEVAAPEIGNDCDAKNLVEIREHVSESDQNKEISSAVANGDVLPTSYSTSVNLSEVSPLSTTPTPVNGDKTSKFEWRVLDIRKVDKSPEQDADRKPTTKDQILSITTPLLLKQRQQVEEYFKLVAPGPLPSVSTNHQLLGLDEDDFRDSSVETESRSPSPVADTEVKIFQKLGISPTQQVGEKREHLYKILVIGELGTGKTSIIKRYVHQFFSQHYRATIGVDFALKVLNWDANTIIRLQLWDIAGQERFGNMTRVYYKEAVGAFVVFDVTRAATFDAVVKWKQDLDAKVQLPDGTSIPCVLLANKCDQQKEGIVNSPSKMDEYCKDWGFTAWFETSAKENINIEDAARSLVTRILQNEMLTNHNESSKDLERFALDGKNQRDQKSKTCSC